MLDRIEADFTKTERRKYFMTAKVIASILIDYLDSETKRAEAVRPRLQAIVANRLRTLHPALPFVTTQLMDLDLGIDIVPGGPDVRLPSIDPHYTKSEIADGALILATGLDCAVRIATDAQKDLIIHSDDEPKRVRDLINMNYHGVSA